MVGCYEILLGKRHCSICGTEDLRDIIYLRTCVYRYSLAGYLTLSVLNVMRRGMLRMNP